MACTRGDTLACARLMPRHGLWLLAALAMRLALAEVFAIGFSGKPTAVKKSKKGGPGPPLRALQSRRRGLRLRPPRPTPVQGTHASPAVAWTCGCMGS
jgi:hypothetical protein